MYPHGKMRCQEIDGEQKKERIKPKKRELHGLQYTEIVKSETRLASDNHLCVEKSIFL